MSGTELLGLFCLWMLTTGFGVLFIMSVVKVLDWIVSLGCWVHSLFRGY